MSFGEGDLRERVDELERENERLQSRLAEGGQMHHRALERGRELESLVRFMLPFFKAAILPECGCPDWYFDPDGGCDNGCKALRELGERMAELGIGTEGGA